MKPKMKMLLLSLIVLTLLPSCAMAVVGGIRGDYDDVPYTPRTPQEESQSQMYAIAFGLAFLVLVILSRGNSLRAIIFSMIGIAIAGCFLLA